MNPSVAHVLQFFEYKHLPPHLAAVSMPFCNLAHAMARGDNNPESGTCTFGSPLPDNAEKTVALRKLLESKDAAVRAVLAGTCHVGNHPAIEQCPKCYRPVCQSHRSSPAPIWTADGSYGHPCGGAL